MSLFAWTLVILWAAVAIGEFTDLMLAMLGGDLWPGVRDLSIMLVIASLGAVLWPLWVAVWLLVEAGPHIYIGFFGLVLKVSTDLTWGFSRKEAGNSFRWTFGLGPVAVGRLAPRAGGA